MAIPNRSFKVWDRGRKASLSVQNLPMPDTFFFGNNVSISGSVDVDLRWEATADPVWRGKGLDVPADDWAAFRGEFADAKCRGRIKGRETGFNFRTDRLSQEGFFAQLGPEHNGIFLHPH